MADISGTNLGPYELRAKLGQGGMGTVYHGYQPTMDRDVAIKILPAVLVQDPEFIARFRREARTIANLGHARILPVHDYGEQDGLAYLVMRYLDGSTLHERITKDGPMTPKDAARIIRQVAEGLGYAHSHGIIHRDMTANNIMFDSVGDAYITDFGLAKIMEGAAQLTGSGILGTPAYMSPEQGLGDHVDHRADIYALGVVLFEMLTGDVPYSGSSAMVIVVKHINEPIPDPTEIRPDIPQAVAQVIFKATAKNPDERFQSVGDMADALDAAVRGQAGLSMGKSQGTMADGTRRLPPNAPATQTPAASAPEEGFPIWLIPTGVLIGLLILAAVYVFVIMPKRTAEASPTPTLMVLATQAVAEAPTDVPQATDAPQPTVAPTEPTQPPVPTPPDGGPGGQALPPDQGLFNCPAGLEQVLAYDFRQDRTDGMQVFAKPSSKLSLQGDAMVIQPMQQGEEPLPIMIGQPVSDTYVWLKASWSSGQGVVAVETNFDMNSHNSYNFVVDGAQKQIHLEKNRSPLGGAPMNASLFDGKNHDIVFSVSGSNLVVLIDNQNIATAQDSSPLPAGLIHLHVLGSPMSLDAIGACGAH